MIMFVYHDESGNIFGCSNVPNSNIAGNSIEIDVDENELNTLSMNYNVQNGALASTLNSAAAWAGVRAQRDLLIAACDWTQLPDVPLNTKAAWATYRQALRDITKQADPKNITWPTSP